jgi:prepilin-type N-terminal cleavage/methylation domain-containing protein
MIRPVSRSLPECAPWRQGRWRAGFSLTEIIVVICVLTVLAGVAMVAMSGAFLASKESLAQSRVEWLNRALYEFAQQNYEMVFTSRDDTAADEMFVLRSIQYRNPDEDKAKLGSPYITPTYNPVASSETSDYRIRWTGKLYQLIRPGDEGLGLKMDFEAKDMTTAFQFPPNFQMAGR